MPTQEDITRLEGRIDELGEELRSLRRQLAQAEMDQWEGRIDDLEVQMHLGRQELTDRLAPLVETMRNRWLDAKEQVGLSSNTATDVIDTLREGLEQAMQDIRSAVRDARKAAAR